MTGPEHYKAAEEILAEAKDADPRADHADMMLLLKFAELHVGLAQAAATALNDHSHQGDGGMPVADYNAWCDAAGGAS